MLLGLHKARLDHRCIFISFLYLISNICRPLKCFPFPCPIPIHLASPGCFLGCYNQSSLCPDDLNWWANGTFLCALRHTCPPRRWQENVYLPAWKAEICCYLWSGPLLIPFETCLFLFFLPCHLASPPPFPSTPSLSLARCLLPCLLRLATTGNCLHPSLWVSDLCLWCPKL